jgi:hypothetical protein
VLALGECLSPIRCGTDIDVGTDSGLALIPLSYLGREILCIAGSHQIDCASPKAASYHASAPVTGQSFSRSAMMSNSRQLTSDSSRRLRY